MSKTSTPGPINSSNHSQSHPVVLVGLHPLQRCYGLIPPDVHYKGMFE